MVLGGGCSQMMGSYELGIPMVATSVLYSGGLMPCVTRMLSVKWVGWVVAGLSGRAGWCGLDEGRWSLRAAL